MQTLPFSAEDIFNLLQDNHTTYWYDAMDDILKAYITEKFNNAPIEQLGAGGYGTVFSHPYYNDKVIKITRECGDCWIDFIKFKTSNPWFPVVYSIDQYEWCNVVVMEKLQFFDIRNEYQKIMYNVLCSASYICNTEVKTKTEFLERIRHYMNTQYGSFTHDHEDVLYDVYPMLVDLRTLYQTLDTHNIIYCDDIRLDNLMIRGNQLIINDPIA